ncbi:DUF2510 domain-containing protein [Phycicoccus flavus]|uniref:DUF2510 domain-containing protein n=1 Tax=Phycicoccus flavus TaxID=2502783 RepID=UPI00197BE2E8|nr:DUF2510 domain-containing protein [Phycicoccus flavus]
MSAPPGWHPQPDGRERWWDGQQWTEHFRDPVAPTQQYGAVEPGYGPPQQTGYNPPPAGYQQQRSGMSGGAKGCLIAAVVFVLLLVVAVVVAFFWFGANVVRSVDDVQQQLDSQGDSAAVVVVTVGEGFDVGSATVEDGWGVADGGGVGQRVEGMDATFGAGVQEPSIFTMTFPGQDGGEVDTLCTATPDGSGGPTAVTCLPLFQAVDAGGEVQVTPRL